MPNPKKIEKKLPLLIANGPSFGFDYEAMIWRLAKLKHDNPDLYATRKNNILQELEKLRHDVDSNAMKRRQERMPKSGFTDIPDLFDVASAKKKDIRLRLLCFKAIIL